jgi:hypothetical protein
LLFGDLPLDQWPGPGTPAQGAPWDSFIAARAELAAGQRDEAIELWRHIAARTDIEARHVLQAWTFLRQAGIAPDAEDAKDVVGVVVSVPVQHGHDVLAGYRDGSVRYINFSGAAVVVRRSCSSRARRRAGVTASAEAGVSSPVGYRWFRHAGVNPCLPPTVSGRYLSFSEREDIAQSHGVREIARRVRRVAVDDHA